jgi:hypothetical protein
VVANTEDVAWKPAGGTLRQDWAGALADYREYTALELEQKVLA